MIFLQPGFFLPVFQNRYFNISATQQNQKGKKVIMKQLIKWQLVTILMFCASASYAGNVGVDLNIHLGEQPRQVIVREPEPVYQPVYQPVQPVYQPVQPVYQPVQPVYQPVYQPPVQQIQVDEDVQFIYPGPLGFYVAVGLPYDLFYVQNNYYLYRDGRWSRASRSQGPWVFVDRRGLPPGLRRHKIERIHHYRDQEYVVYRRDQERYRGRHFRSAKEEWKEQRREMKREEREERKEAKREEKGERRNHKRDKYKD
jgi:hypothetical protein